MNIYLVTPTGTLGSASFRVLGNTAQEALENARKHIRREDWHSTWGWELYKLEEEFSDDNAA